MSSSESTALKDIDKPHYNYLQAFYMSFYSSRLYVDVGKRWRKFGLLYLLMVIAIAVLPFAVRIMHDFSGFFNNELLLPLKKMPLVTVQNGQISYDGVMPYFAKNKQGQVVTIVDTTGNTNETAISKFPQLRVLITKNQFIYWPPSPTFFFAEPTNTVSIQPITQRLDKNMNDVFDGEKWIRSSGVKKVFYLSVAIIYPSLVLILYSMYLVAVLVFAMMAQFIVNLFLKFSLTYPQACRLLAVSGTPHILVLFAIIALNWIFFGVGFVLFLFFAVYFTFAVLSLKKASNKLVRL